MTNAIPNYGTVYPELPASGVYNSCQYAFIKHAGYPKQVNSAGPWDRARGSIVSATEILGRFLGIWAVASAISAVYCQISTSRIADIIVQALKFILYACPVSEKTNLGAAAPGT